MISFIKRKLERAKLKRTFQEYGYNLKEFSLKEHGIVHYAQ
jgi:hypothetical protein